MEKQPIDKKLVRRRSKRIPIRLNVIVSSPNSYATLLHCSSENVSTSGICLLPISDSGLPNLNKALAKGDQLKLEFSIPGSTERVKSTGKVRWLDTCLDHHNTEYLYSLGLSFESLAKGPKLEITKLITNLLRRPHQQQKYHYP